MKKYTTARLLLGDQLNGSHSWFKNKDNDVLYVLMEIKAESEYVTHHVQKIAGIFAAMRQFAEDLKVLGHNVAYLKITDEHNQHSFSKNLNQLIEQHEISQLNYQLPDEYRLDTLFKKEFKKLNVEVTSIDTEHFFTERLALKEQFKGKKTYLMESFYRKMRKEHNVLMDGEQPISGKWNYDKQNRNKLPKNHVPTAPKLFSNNVTEVVNDIEQSKLKYIGEIDAENFIWPITLRQSNELLTYFIENLLQHFGDFQDAMSNEYWSIYHSRLSFSINLKLISPKKVVEAAEKFWANNQDKISLSQVEGFIRQILGWREYMRGVYWAQMPEYASLNFFNANKKLPKFFWDGNTKMNCLKKSINQSLKYGYAHHIQRLMVTGNFCALAGINPNEVDEWYLGIYVDAFDWVEITNTRGMSQFADGGIVGTKPYVSSASYINKMGDYCSNCHYSKTKKTGEKSCPFNSLYWHFLARNHEQLKTNHRMNMMYSVWFKMDDSKQKEILQQADQYLEDIENL